jgi:hypothetical protein
MRRPSDVLGTMRGYAAPSGVLSFAWAAPQPPEGFRIAKRDDP